MYDIYQSSQEDTRRYLLGKSGARPLIAVGLNPSTATRERSDPTVAKVEGVARRNGFDGFLMLNLYPVRATHYETLAHEPDLGAWAENVEHVVAAVSDTPNGTVWAAWGQSILARQFFVDACVAIASRTIERRIRWVRLGSLTQGGHPRHPSRLDYQWQFAEFDLTRYVQSFFPREPG